MLRAYAAIEMMRGETPHGTIHRFMQAAVACNLLFAELEVLDVFTIGSRRFVRFKTDQLQLDQATLDIRKDRGVVLPNGAGGYRVCLPGGREGQVSSVVMHRTPAPSLKRFYRGPSNDLWESQFHNILDKN